MVEFEEGRSESRDALREQQGDYVAGYADAYIDALSDCGVVEVTDRVSSPERDRMRATCRTAAILMGAAYDGDPGLDVPDFLDESE